KREARQARCAMIHDYWRMFMVKLLALYLPDCIIGMYVTFSLMGMKWSRRQLLVLCATQAVLLMVIRDVLGLVGWHTLVTALAHILIVLLYMKKSIFEAVFSKAIHLMLLLFGELSIGLLLLRRLDMN